MNGMELKPAAVGVHLATATGRAMGLLLTANLDARTMALMVAPGIVTEARDCQMRQSKVTTKESTVAVGDCDFILSWYVAYPEVPASAKQYPNATT